MARMLGRFTSRGLLAALVLWAAGCSSTPAPVPPDTTPTGPEWRYALLIDASSSASTLQIFQWRPMEGRLPRIQPAPVDRSKGEPDWEIKARPGLGAYAGRPEEAAASLAPLFTFALEKIGRDPRTLALTSVYLRATAGVRLLPQGEQDAMLDAVRRKLAQLPFASSSARVISGQEEGLYGWLAVNYLLGHLQHGGRFPTVGALDLGGASTQITYQPIDHPRTGGHVLELGGTRYHLYTQSYLGFGQDEARAGVDSAACFLTGYPRGDKPSGTGDFEACRVDILSKLSGPCTGDDAPCSPFDDERPPIYGNFLAFSVYAYTSGFFNLDQRLMPRELASRGTEFCRTDWQKWLEREPEIADDPYLPLYCFSAAYVTALLEDGFGFPTDTERITAPLAVQGVPVGWSLGALLYEIAGAAD